MTPDTGYELTRFLFQRGLGFVYLIAFLITFNQFRGLCGERGLLPARNFIQRMKFTESPSLFFLSTSDRFSRRLAGAGIFLSALALTGISDAFTTPVSMLVWAALWLIYLSFVNVGQTFYGFGWETLLLETGFLTIFLGATNSPASALPIFLLRWVLFRLMFGAGLIKIRGDSCWRDLTCMKYHYETQPLPNPLSPAFHRLPMFMHKTAVVFTHFTELAVPFAYFLPQPFCALAGLITIAFQGSLILSGNLSWLNYVTIVLAFTCFDNEALRGLSSVIFSFSGQAVAGVPGSVLYLLAGLVAILSIRPTRNLFSGAQLMNASFEPLHLVNTYGAFGSITRNRYEVILEGTEDETLTSETKWTPYEFKAKPGAPERPLRFVSPYHFKLDWQMWFAAMSRYWDHLWILNLVAKLLQNESEVVKLLGANPFAGKAPRFIRAEWYAYHYAAAGSRAHWDRTRVGTYLPPLSLDDEGFITALQRLGWIDSEQKKEKAA